MRMARLTHERDALKTSLLKLTAELDHVRAQHQAAARQGLNKPTTAYREEVRGWGVRGRGGQAG